MDSDNYLIFTSFIVRWCTKRAYSFNSQNEKHGHDQSKAYRPFLWDSNQDEMTAINKKEYRNKCEFHFAVILRLKWLRSNGNFSAHTYFAFVEISRNTIGCMNFTIIHYMPNSIQNISFCERLCLFLVWNNKWQNKYS